MYEYIPFLLGFLTVFIGTPLARKYLMSSGIYGIDQNKPEKPKIPTSGGIIVLFGFVLSVTSFIGLNKILGPSNFNLSLILAALNSATIIALIGLIDDIHIDLEKVLNEQIEKEVILDLKIGKIHFVETFFSSFTEDENAENMHRKGISKLPKMVFVLPAVFPLMAVGAGSWTMSFPYIGTVNWGVFYPLFLLPVGLLFVSHVVNMLAGVNGLSTALSFVTAIGLGLFAVLNLQMEAALIAFSLAVCLGSFLYYNIYPASILPGDSLTYLSGAVLFSTIVIGDMEKFGVFIFSLWILEFFLKLRSSMGADSWGLPQPDGTLKPKYARNYSLTHPLMRKGYGEKQIVYILTALQSLIILAGIIIFGPALI